jgi:hypothetical protein
MAWRHLVFASVVITVGSACGGKSSSTPTNPSPTPTPQTQTPAAPTLQSVTLSVNADGMRARGDTAQVTASGTFSNGTSQSVTSSCSGWQSDNVGVLTISGSGLITAQASGGSTVTTTCQGVFGNRLVTLALGPRTSFGAGQYLVGSDIASGRYFSSPRDGCYWERNKGLSGSLDDVLANDFIGFNAGQWVVDILRSDLAFKTDSDCGTWNQSPRGGVQAEISPGMWLVGSQITPGRYRANASYACYWERMRHFEGTLGGILANDFVDSAGQVIVDIRSSDVGFQADDECGRWSRVSSLTASDSETDEKVQSPAEIEVEWERHRRSKPSR